MTRARLVPARLVYERWTHPVAGDLLAERPELEVHKLDMTRPAADGWSVLERAHGYQSATRTDAAGMADGGQWLPGRALIERCPDLLAVCVAGAGFDVVDVDACTDAGVIVCNNSGPGSEAVAEHALGLMIGLAKNITRADRALRSGQLRDRGAFTGTDVRHKTLGVIGLGAIGQRLVELCAPFAMEVLAFDPYVDPGEARVCGVTLVELDDLLARADFVQVTCPLTEETARLIGARELALMKPTTFFVTTARGGIHDEAALLAALTEGRLQGAGLDVFSDEPPRPDNPLLQLDNVIATPHVAGITRESVHDLAVATAEQWLTIFSGHRPARLINPEAWPRFSARFHETFCTREGA